MAETLKTLADAFVGEGYVEQEKNNHKNDPWVNIYAAYQNSLISQDYVVAIENIKAGDSAVPCMILKFGDDIKGIIPVSESGIPGTEIILSAQDKDAKSEDESKADAAEEPASKKKGRKKKSEQELHIEDENGIAPATLVPVMKSASHENHNDSVPMGMVVARMRAMVGQLVVFKVKAIDRENCLCILSRKDALDQMQAVAWKEIKEGEVRSSVVRYVTNALVYLNISGIEAKMPAREAAYGFVADARDIVKPGDVIDVKVMKLDTEQKRIFVSARALKDSEEIWNHTLNKYRVKGEYLGTLTGIIQTGMFISLERDVDVFVAHPRSMDVRQRLKIGQKMIIRITGINQGKRRLLGRFSRFVG